MKPIAECLLVAVIAGCLWIGIKAVEVLSQLKRERADTRTLIARYRKERS